MTSFLALVLAGMYTTAGDAWIADRSIAVGPPTGRHYSAEHQTIVGKRNDKEKMQ